MPQNSLKSFDEVGLIVIAAAAAGRRRSLRRPQVNADHGSIRRGIDDDELGVWARKPAAAIGFARLVADRIEYMSPIVAQIDDELHRAIREHTLQAMIGVEAFMKPKQLDELVERRLWRVRGVDHKWRLC